MIMSPTDVPTKVIVIVTIYDPINCVGERKITSYANVEKTLGIILKPCVLILSSVVKEEPSKSKNGRSAPKAANDIIKYVNPRIR